MGRFYKGGIIRANPITTTGGGTGVASGVWNMGEQTQLLASNLWPTVPVPAGQQAYTTAGTYSWVAPAGVTSVCVVCVGGGGSYTGSSAGDSYFINTSTVAGFKGLNGTGSPLAGGTYAGDGGGDGGNTTGTAGYLTGGGAGG